MTLTGSEEKDRRFATTLARGLQVLRAFRASDDGLGNQEISIRTGIPKSTVSRLTFTLHQLGYLSHARRHDRYRFGPAALALGNIASASVSFIETANPMMQQLADETGTLTLLAVLDESKMLLTKTWRPQGAPAIWLEVGHRISVAGSSSGHAYLASVNDSEFARVCDKVRARDESVLVEDLEHARHSGYSQLLSHGFVMVDEDRRYAENINAVSTGFRSHDFGEPVAISCGATPEILSYERMRNEVGPKLRDRVKELERALGLSSVLINRG
ncbi:IclR family transcriptional regulator [Pseudovibrio sp. Tun.PSC04-5.I4]|uniref:IclR family transcriptional regulator n=1 Tax=Pseudovibrio sp. Tun.PSC04-5.I4 TaxID=1798213 RepID=UPI0008875CC9|nr:IclR family transcriptional regulator [Pseudovibrio sp. Tun.PSC04-5.I4]SDR14367.1 DNA-binding transcriptional regulator, IclR family [Pseudovibrio sp. Tun.PSC04-5.I4]